MERCKSCGQQLGKGARTCIKCGGRDISNAGADFQVSAVLALIFAGIVIFFLGLPLELFLVLWPLTTFGLYRFFRWLAFQ
jgi:uncharacterized protein (DUF983 family)